MNLAKRLSALLEAMLTYRHSQRCMTALPLYSTLKCREGTPWKKKNLVSSLHVLWFNVFYRKHIFHTYCSEQNVFGLFSAANALAFTVSSEHHFYFLQLSFNAHGPREIVSFTFWCLYFLCADCDDRDKYWFSSHYDNNWRECIQGTQTFICNPCGSYAD